MTDLVASSTPAFGGFLEALDTQVTFESGQSIRQVTGHTGTVAHLPTLSSGENTHHVPLRATDWSGGQGYASLTIYPDPDDADSGSVSAAGPPGPVYSPPPTISGPGKRGSFALQIELGKAPGADQKVELKPYRIEPSAGALSPPKAIGNVLSELGLSPTVEFLTKQKKRLKFVRGQVDPGKEGEYLIEMHRLQGTAHKGRAFVLLRVKKTP